MTAATSISVADFTRAIRAIPDHANPGPFKLFAPGPRSLERWTALFPGIEVVPAYEVPK